MNDAGLFQYDYKVKLENRTDTNVIVDIYVPDETLKEYHMSRPIGFFGYPLPRGACFTLQLPDFIWWGWGGPFRIGLHIQDHKMCVKVVTDEHNKLSNLPSANTELAVYPGSSVTVTSQGVAIAHDEARTKRSTSPF